MMHRWAKYTEQHMQFRMKKKGAWHLGCVDIHAMLISGCFMVIIQNADRYFELKKVAHCAG